MNKPHSLMATGMPMMPAPTILFTKLNPVASSELFPSCARDEASALATLSLLVKSKKFASSSSISAKLV